MSKYLVFVPAGVSDSGKTKKWDVQSSGVHLGWVSWYSHWRKYTFNPGDSIFDHACLREIADFIESETAKHKS
jgi:hypothetical protein